MNSRFLDDAVLDDRDVKPLKMVCECRLDITWYRIPNTEWTDARARARIDEATRWFNTYCIHLNFEELALDATKPAEKKIQQELDALNAEYKARVARVLRARPAPQNLLNDIQSTVISIYDQIVKKTGAGRLIVLFLDEWFVKVGVTANPAYWRTFRISANDGLRLLVGIDRYDTGSPHILTHELVHALRKAGTNNNRNEFNAFVAANNVTNINARVWQEHYAGKNQDDAMSFTNRAMAFRPFSKDTTDVLTVREYLTLLHAGLVKAVPGCRCEERKRREKRKRR